MDIPVDGSLHPNFGKTQKNDDNYYGYTWGG
jgi:hypothetical protein